MRVYGRAIGRRLHGGTGGATEPSLTGLRTSFGERGRCAPLSLGQSCHFRAKKELSVPVVEGLSGKANVAMGISCWFRAFRIAELLAYQAIGKLPRVTLTHRSYGRSEATERS